MQIRPAQLASHLAKGLAPLYVIHGDEPLLAIEAGDEIRAAARAAGFDEREVLVAEPGFKWDAFAAANRNLALFGARKLVDLAIPSAKPGAPATCLVPSASSQRSRPRVKACRLSSGNWARICARSLPSSRPWPGEPQPAPQSAPPACGASARRRWSARRGASMRRRFRP